MHLIPMNANACPITLRWMPDACIKPRACNQQMASKKIIRPLLYGTPIYLYLQRSKGQMIRRKWVRGSRGGRWVQIFGNWVGLKVEGGIVP